MVARRALVVGAVVAAALPAAAAGAVAGASKAPTVALRSTHLGKILVVGATGRTLYAFASDGKNKSNCTGPCAQAWPPLLVNGKPTAGKGVSAAKLGEIKRGNSHQVTYAGHPLYRFVGDSAPGQTTGQGSGGFHVIGASGRPIG